MITSLLIDGVEYLEYLLFDEINKLTFQVDEGINSPLCPIYEFSLLNRDKLEDVFLKNYPYKLYEEAHIELFVDSIKRFDGYVDKENSDIKKNAEKLYIYAVSRDKKIGVGLAEHDITQMYYIKDINVPVRQRGGRSAQVLRFNHTEYNNIENLIAAMLEDQDLTSQYITYGSKELNYSLEYRYNSEKFGQIEEKKNIGTWRIPEWYTSDSYPNSIVFRDFKRNENNTESYDTFIKEFAKISGCNYFYNPKDDKYYFCPRNSLIGDTINIDQLMLYDDNDGEHEINIKYKNAFDGIIVEFDDISLLIKIEVNEGVLTYKYGVDAESYVMVQLPNGEYFLYLTENYGLTLGPTFFHDSLFIENALKIKMNAIALDYLRTGFAISPFPSGSRVDFFLQMLLHNYKDSLLYYKEIETRLNGTYFPPFIAKLNGTDYACWYGEVDFNSEETLIKIEIGDFDSVIPADVDLVMEDDVFILDL